VSPQERWDLIRRHWLLALEYGSNGNERTEHHAENARAPDELLGRAPRRESEADRLGVQLRCEVPIDIATRKSGDEREPIAIRRSENHPVSRICADTAKQVADAVA